MSKNDLALYVEKAIGDWISANVQSDHVPDEQLQCYFMNDLMHQAWRHRLNNAYIKVLYQRGDEPTWLIDNAAILCNRRTNKGLWCFLDRQAEILLVLTE